MLQARDQLLGILTATLPEGLAACCVFGDPGSAPCIDAQIARGHTDKTDQVSCPAPSSAAAGFVRLGLSLNGGVDVSPQGSYLYTQIGLSSLSPASAASTGGTQITLSGRGFLALGIAPSVARCRFTYATALPRADGLGLSRVEDVPLVALRDGDAECTPLRTCGCASPASGCAISVGFLRNGVDMDGSLPLTYYAPMAVSHILPSGGPVGGGTVITVVGGPFAAVGSTAGAHCRIGRATIPAVATEAAIVCNATHPLLLRWRQ